MSDPFVAEVRCFGFNFAPTGWAQCNGQLVSISQNTALFSLLGTFYGGNGQSTFALPDLQGSVTIGSGQGPGLSDRFIGEQGGAQQVTLLQSEIPVHDHAILASNDAATANTAAGNHPARPFGRGNSLFSTSQAPIANLAPEALAPAGGDQPHSNLMPYLTMNFCIALQGIFPPRS